MSNLLVTGKPVTDQCPTSNGLVKSVAEPVTNVKPIGNGQARY
jgi:hypothetical protein